ncbi:MAG: hypothetical protein ACRCSS_17780, partial [Shewanella sp.]
GQLILFGGLVGSISDWGVNYSVNATYKGFYKHKDTWFSLTNPISNSISDTWTNQLQELYGTLEWKKHHLKIGRFDPTFDTIAWYGGSELFNFLSFNFSGSTWLMPPHSAVGATYTYHMTEDKLNYFRFVVTDAVGNFNSGFGYKNLWRNDLWKTFELGLANKATGQGAYSVKLTAFHIDSHKYFNDEPMGTESEEVKGVGIQTDYEIYEGLRPFFRIGFAENSKADMMLSMGTIYKLDSLGLPGNEVGIGWSYSELSDLFKNANMKDEQLWEVFYKKHILPNAHVSLIGSYFINPGLTDGGGLNVGNDIVKSNFISSVRATVMF